MRRALTIVAGLLTACGVLQAADWTVYLRRAGPVRIGMPLAEVRRLIGDPQAALESPLDEPEECAYLRTDALPEGLALMFMRGRVVRIDVHGNLRTASGVGVGDSEETVQRTYPNRITVEPHKYLEDDGHYLRYTTRDAVDRGFGLIFETYQGKVTSFRTGTLEAIALVEGCS